MYLEFIGGITMIAILLGHQKNKQKKNQELTSIKVQGGQVYRDNYGRQFAIFNYMPRLVAGPAQVTELKEIPNNWIRVS